MNDFKLFFNVVYYNGNENMKGYNIKFTMASLKKVQEYEKKNIKLTESI